MSHASQSPSPHKHAPVQHLGAHWSPTLVVRDAEIPSRVELLLSDGNIAVAVALTGACNTYRALVCFMLMPVVINPASLSGLNASLLVDVRVRADRHVVRLYEVYETPDNVYIVLENCPCGDLEKMLYLRG